MPPRYAYWTILIDHAPTAFRAREKDELLPTLKQLQRANPNAEVKWFARGRLWASPEEAQAARAPIPEKRGPAWRPGGRHEDPRDRFKKKSRERRERDERTGSRDAHEHRPERPREEHRDRPQEDRRDRPREGERPPFRPKGPGGPPRKAWGRPPQDRRPAGGGRPPFNRSGEFRPREDRPPAREGGRPPFRPKGPGGPPREGERPPFRPKGPGGPPREGERPPFRPKGPGGPPRKPWGRPPQDRRPAGGGRPPFDRGGNRPPSFRDRDDRRERPRDDQRESREGGHERPREDRPPRDEPRRPFKPKGPGGSRPANFRPGSGPRRDRSGRPPGKPRGKK